MSVSESKNNISLYFEVRFYYSISTDLVMQSVPVLVLFWLLVAPASSPSHLSSIILRILVTCGCLTALIEDSSSELLLDKPENILMKHI